MCRIVSRVSGEPFITVRIRPTFSYNSSDGYQTRGSHHIRYCGPNQTLRLTTDCSVQSILHETQFLLAEPLHFFLGQDESFTSSVRSCADSFQKQTEAYWKDWCANLVLPRSPVYQPILIRSAIQIALLQSAECGGIVKSLTM